MNNQPLSRVLKDPDSTLDYGVDWSEWIEKTANGDTISAVTWIVPPGLTKVSNFNSGTLAVVYLSGGTLKKVYAVTCRITTTNGRTEDYSFELQIADK